MKPIIFSGRSCPKLAAKIAEVNHLSLGKLECVTFANSEIKVRILSEVKDQEVIIVQATSFPTNDNLMELLLMIDACRRGKAKSLTVLIPYLGYARQNLQHLPGECVSLNVVVKMLESLEVNGVVTLDIHDEASSGIFSIPFTNLSALGILAKRLYEDLKIKTETEDKFLIASPDQGGVERARTFADNFYHNKKNAETIVIEKKRDLSQIHQSEAVEVYGDVQGKNVILVDDVSTSGKTIINAANLCLKNGAQVVTAVVVHSDFAKGIPLLIQQSGLTHFFTTNSIEKTREDLSEYSKIKVVEIAHLFQL